MKVSLSFDSLKELDQATVNALCACPELGSHLAMTVKHEDGSAEYGQWESEHRNKCKKC